MHLIVLGRISCFDSTRNVSFSLNSLVTPCCSPWLSLPLLLNLQRLTFHLELDPSLSALFLGNVLSLHLSDSTADLVHVLNASNSTFKSQISSLSPQTCSLPRILYLNRLHHHQIFCSMWNPGYHL